MNLWPRNKILVLPAEHFSARLWQPEPRFLRADPM